MLAPRLHFGFVDLRRPNGARILILAELIGQMEEAVGEGVKIDPETKIETKENIRVTIVRSPFGMETVVMETPQQIADQLATASMDAIRTMTKNMAAAPQLVVAAGGLPPGR